MRNASGQQGENEQQWKRTQATKFFVRTYDISSMIKRATTKFQVEVLQINSKEMYKNQDCVLHMQSRFFFFLLIRLTEFFCRSHCRGRLALHNIFFCLACSWPRLFNFQQTYHTIFRVTIFREHGKMARIPYQSSRIALSNDSVFNKKC